VPVVRLSRSHALCGNEDSAYKVQSVIPLILEVLWFVPILISPDSRGVNGDQAGV